MFFFWIYLLIGIGVIVLWDLEESFSLLIDVGFLVSYLILKCLMGFFLKKWSFGCFMFCIDFVMIKNWKC